MSTLRVNSIANTGGVDLFANSKTSPGYQKLPNGLIVQWGRYSTTIGANSTVTYPIAFTATPLSLTVGYESGSGVGWVVRYGGLTNSQFSVVWDYWSTSGSGAATQVHWIAIGY